MSDDKKAKPRAPANLGAAAKRLWSEVTGKFELMPNELPVLREVVRVVDRLEQLDRVVTAEGVMKDGRPHPALVEARQQEIVLGRLLVTLRLPEDWANVESRPQSRGGARGPYGPRAVGGAS